MNNPKAKDNLKPFVKGDDPRRNTDGRPPMPDLKQAMADLMNDKQNDMTALQAILKTLFKRALSGDVRAAAELLDRAYGKSTQVIDANIEGKSRFASLFPSQAEINAVIKTDGSRPESDK